MIRRLRGPGGCPWDAKQTPQSVRRYLVEEAYEAAEAVRNGDRDEITSELGDLLFQVLFMVEQYRELKITDLEEVVAAAETKMIRRHPHVFGDVQADDSDQVLRNWQAIKREEKGDETFSALGEVPRGMPALMRADRLSRRAASVGFDWESPGLVLEKVHEETEELDRALENNNRDEVAEEMGDLMFSLANLARHLDLEPEALLQQANSKFEDRFRKMESLVQESGRQVSETEMAELDRLWEAVKRAEGAGGRG